MLGIIFTRKRMLVGWVVEDAVKWLNVGQQGTNYIKHQGNLLATLQFHFNHILDTAQWHAFGNGMTPLDSPPLALVFPSDEKFITEQEKQAIVTWLTSLPIRWASVQMSSTLSLLAKSLPHRHANFLLFEAFDEIAYTSSNIAHLQTQLAQFDFSVLGKNEGIKNIFTIILSEIRKKDIFISTMQEEELWNAVEYFDVNKKLIIKQLDSFPKVSMDVTLSQSRYYDLLTVRRESYKNILNILKIFENSNISLIFAADLYDNSVFSDYMSHISKSSFFANGEILFFNDKFCFEKMLIYLNKFQAKQPEFSGRMTKSKLIAEIKQKCNDKRKYNAYFSKYAPLAVAVGMPHDILTWYIRQNLYGLSSLNTIGEVISPTYAKKLDESPHEHHLIHIAATEHSFAPQYGDDSVHRNFINPEPKALAISPEALPASSNTNLFEHTFKFSTLNPSLSYLDEETLCHINIFAAFEQEFLSKEFLYFKGTLKQDAKPRVFRMLKNNIDTNAVNAFTLLHEREKGYFNDISPIFRSSENGLYYYRNYIEAETLESYVKRVGLNKKYRLKDLNAIDLELMLELWRSIYFLKFAYANLTKESFIVCVHWRLPFKKEIEVKIIDFDTSTSSKEQMERNLTQIFEEIFGENLTNEFKQRFQNT